MHQILEYLMDNVNPTNDEHITILTNLFELGPQQELETKINFYRL